MLGKLYVEWSGCRRILNVTNTVVWLSGLPVSRHQTRWPVMQHRKFCCQINTFHRLKARQKIPSLMPCKVPLYARNIDPHSIGRYFNYTTMYGYLKRVSHLVPVDVLRILGCTTLKHLKRWPRLKVSSIFWYILACLPHTARRGCRAKSFHVFSCIYVSQCV